MSEMDVRGDSLPLDEIPDEIGIEADAADAAEQLRAVREADRWRTFDLPFDVDPADAAEQNRTVDLDEDDYR
jgi:hypothetical protein